MLQKSESLHILTNSLGKRKVCAKWIPHVLNSEQRAMRVLLASAHLQNWRNESNAFLNCNVTADESWMHSFDPQLKQENAEWHAQMSPRKKSHSTQLRCSESQAPMFFSRNGLALDHPMPIGMTVNGQNYHALLQDEVSLILHCTQPELLEHGIILLQDHATPHHHCDVQNLNATMGLGGVGTSF